MLLTPAQLAERCWGCARTSPRGSCFPHAWAWSQALGCGKSGWTNLKTANFVLLIKKKLFRRKIMASNDLLVTSAAYLPVLL